MLKGVSSEANTIDGITSLTGDVTATGPGAAAATLATAQPAVQTWALAQTFSAGVIIAAAQTISWASGTVLRTASDGNLTITNNAGNSFGLLTLGAATSSFPAFKRSTTTVQARLADDSAFTNIQGKLTTDTAATTGLVAGALAALTTGSIVVYDSTGTAYQVPVLAV